MLALRRLAVPLLSIAVAGLLAGCLGGGDSSAIDASEMWARVALSGGNTAVYGVLRNGADEADRLTGVAVSGEVAAKADMHTTVVENGVARMEMMPGFDLDGGGGTVTFAPGGHHIMLMKVADPLEPGDTFTLTLTFERAGAIAVDVEVRTE